MGRLKQEHPVTGLHQSEYVAWGDSCYRVGARNVLYRQETQAHDAARQDERREADDSFGRKSAFVVK